MKVFLDTNVLLDILSESRDNNIDSTSILRVANAGYLEAVISTQSILDAYYVAVDVAKTPLETFKGALREILAVVDVVSIDANDIRTAIDGSNEDFEDASQIACADAAGCDFIISSDKKMKRDSSVTVYTPGEFCGMIFKPIKY